MTRFTLFSRSHPISLLIKKGRSTDPQGRSEGTSSVAFEVLIIKWEIDFINLFIFNCLTSNVNLFIFNCLTSNINLFNFNCLTSNFCFPKNIFFASRRERMFMDARVFGFSTQRGKWLPVIFETQIHFWGPAPCARTY